MDKVVDRRWYEKIKCQGNIVFTGTNQAGYWFRWNDRYGQGNLQLSEHTDGSLRGIIHIDDGTMLGKRLGEFVGFRKWLKYIKSFLW